MKEYEEAIVFIAKHELYCENYNLPKNYGLKHLAAFLYDEDSESVTVDIHNMKKSLARDKKFLDF